MKDDETIKWIRDEMVQSREGQATIIAKLEAGETRMMTIEKNLDTVMDSTRQFPALKIDVDTLKRVEEERKIKKVKQLEKELAKKEQIQTKWKDRFYDLFIKALPYLLIASMYLYTQISSTVGAAT